MREIDKEMGIQRLVGDIFLRFLAMGIEVEVAVSAPHRGVCYVR